MTINKKKNKHVICIVLIIYINTKKLINFDYPSDSKGF